MGAITSFIFLYGALYLFERDRIKLDWFQVLVVALIPMLIYLLKAFVTMLVALPPIVDVIGWLMMYPIVFLLLWKMVGVAKWRSAGYTGGLFALNIGILALIAALFADA